MDSPSPSSPIEAVIAIYYCPIIPLDVLEKACKIPFPTVADAFQERSLVLEEDSLYYANG